MDRIWAPWRLAYVSAVDSPKEGCIFCEKPAQSSDEANLIVHRATKCFVILNAFPYNSGHLMVVPYRHLADMEQLEEGEAAELMGLVREATSVLRSVYRPQGFNIGMNVGRAAGAGIDDHLHVHVVPRWEGDTNFMPVLGDTKVMPETLKASYGKLCHAFETRGAKP